METTASHQLKVGIFSAVGILLFCLSIILLGGDRFFFADRYPLKMHMDQVTGLQKGSVVSLSGVPVGNLDSVDFVPNSDEVEVTIHIQRGVKKRITEGTIASVKTQGALGDKFIYLQPGPSSAKPLEDNAIIPMDKTPDLLDMISSKGAEFGKITDVIKEVNILFSNINKDGKPAKLMENLVTSSAELAKFLAEGRETFSMIRNDAVTPLASVMHKLDNGQGTLGALINDPSLHNRLMGMFGDSPRNRFLKPLIRDSIQTSEEKK